MDLNPMLANPSRVAFKLCVSCASEKKRWTLSAKGDERLHDSVRAELEVNVRGLGYGDHDRIGWRPINDGVERGGRS